MTLDRPSILALALSIVSGLFAVWVWSTNVSHSATDIAYALFFTLFLVQTFFSVRLFETIMPSKEPIQLLLNAVLIVLYFALGFYLSSLLLFPLLMTFFFVLAVVKYILMSGSFPYPRLLQRKTLLNQLGAFLSLLAYAAAVMGFAPWCAWAYTIIFTAATFHLFFIKPLYRLPPQR